mmetsp:Transcript_92677/g.299797  ORF Transcript_92677/g.299797 Transcript_92677/m.299797 type:complete len:237 (+) Transcript_92677:515-1225(+)
MPTPIRAAAGGVGLRATTTGLRTGLGDGVPRTRCRSSCRTTSGVANRQPPRKGEAVVDAATAVATNGATRPGGDDGEARHSDGRTTCGGCRSCSCAVARSGRRGAAATAAAADAAAVPQARPSWASRAASLDSRPPTARSLSPTMCATMVSNSLKSRRNCCTSEGVGSGGGAGSAWRQCGFAHPCACSNDGDDAGRDCASCCSGGGDEGRDCVGGDAGRHCAGGDAETDTGASEVA